MEAPPNALTGSELSDALAILIERQQPAMTWGSPGIGKSKIMFQTVTKRLKQEMIDLRLVLLDSVDLRGVPTVTPDGRTMWATPSFLPRKGKGVLFLDEINAAPPSVQAAAYQLVLDRKLGEYELPPGWTVMAAGNREEDGAVVHRMSTALRNRFIHLDLKVDVEDWCRWAVSADIEAVVLAFIRFRPDLLHKFDRNAKAFPTPRSWEFVSNIVAGKPARNIEHALIAGAVGEGAAIEFTAFYQMYRELTSISIDAIMLDPKGAAIPDKPATLYAVSTALARMAAPKNLGRVVTYLERLPVEYNVAAIKSAVWRDKSLASVPDFTKWGVKHADVVF